MVHGRRIINQAIDIKQKAFAAAMKKDPIIDDAVLESALTYLRDAVAIIETELVNRRRSHPEADRPAG